MTDRPAHVGKHRKTRRAPITREMKLAGAKVLYGRFGDDFRMNEIVLVEIAVEVFEAMRRASDLSRSGIAGPRTSKEIRDLGWF